MLSPDVRQKYRADIGIECHVQLRTQTKLFTPVSNDARTAAPNTLISPLCLGLPGTLPVLNEAAVKLAIAAGIALNAKIAELTKFDRKHYFYPDLPKGYQITQYDEPIVGEGLVVVPGDPDEFKVRIVRAHLEEDAGKSTHPSGSDHTLVDLNRAGTPLLEIVSQPDMHSPEEAKAYATELYHLMRYAGVSDCDLYHGNMRFDVNVSVRPQASETLGTRTETKNLNSFRSVERAVSYEIERQIGLLEAGQAVIQQTLGWDEAKQKTLAQRGKEEADDYRYFPEPDLPPLQISHAEVERVRKSLTMTPAMIRETLKKLKLSFVQRETALLYPVLADRLLKLSGKGELDLQLANLLLNDALADEQFQQLFSEFENINNESYLSVANLIELKKLLSDSTVSLAAAKSMLRAHAADFHAPKELAASMGLVQERDESVIADIVDRVVAANPQAAADFKAGEGKAIGFLIGQVMKESEGRANPQLAKQMLEDKLK